MIIAEIENKIRSDFDVTRSEDILTSIVFGRLRYMAPNVLLIPFLSKAKLAFNSGSFEKLLESAFDKVDYHFWPNFNSGKEGDLLLILRKNRHPDQTILILVEVKYFSGKSSREKLGSKDNFIGEDQLAHYFCQLMQNSFESKLENQLATIPKSNRFMVYLTKHRYKPENELKESLRSMVFKSDDRKYFRDHFKKQFFWLSWRELERIISGLNAKHGSYVGFC